MAMLYTLILTAISIALAFIVYPASYHTQVERISDYLIYTQIYIVPILIWFIYLVNLKIRLFSIPGICLLNTAILVVSPFISGFIGNRIEDYKTTTFEKLKQKITFETISDKLYTMENNRSIGITVSFQVSTPEDIKLYPQLKLSPGKQPTDPLIAGYPDFRYHQCSLLLDGKVIFNSRCFSQESPGISYIQWPTVKTGRKMEFRISMIPENCAYTKPGQKFNSIPGARPFTSRDYGPDIAINYEIELALFRQDGSYLLQTKRNSSATYKPKIFYENLAANKNFNCY